MFHPNNSHMDILHCVRKNQSWFHSVIIMKLERVSSQRADTRARLEVSSYQMDHYDLDMVMTMTKRVMMVTVVVEI